MRASNSKTHIYGRLLEAYPIDFLNEQTKQKGLLKDQVIDKILEEKSIDEIKKIVASNFGLFHQYIHIYEINYLPKNENFYPKLENIGKRTTGAYKQKEYLLPITVKYRDWKDHVTKEIKFLVPFRITYNKTKYIISITKNSRKIKSYFPNRQVFPESMPNLLVEIRKFENEQVNVIKLDLNKGIKHFWEGGWYDGAKVAYNDGKGVWNGTMNDQYLLKEHDPDKFNDILKTRLNRNKFVILGDDALIRHFDCDASEGTMKISIHPKLESIPHDIISKILAKNK